MGERATISGHIPEPWYFAGDQAQQRGLIAANRRTLRRLPRDDAWPWLTARMFSVSSSFESGVPLRSTPYRGSVVCFGGSFSKLWEEWGQWLSKFETLLTGLYWEHAAVVLVTETMGHFTYHWRATEAAIARFMEKPPSTVREWKFEGAPRSFR